MNTILKGKVKKSTLINAGVHEDYIEATLASYRGPKVHRGHIYNYIRNMDQVRERGLSLLMFGENNSGKTTLSAILAKAFIIKGLTAKVTNLRDMTDLFTQSWKDASLKQEFDKAMRDVDLLVIDDLNKELHNKATATVLDSVLRYRSNRHKPFIITTNASIDELKEQYGPSFAALLERRCAVLEFKKSIKESDTLINKNLKLLESLGD